MSTIQHALRSSKGGRVVKHMKGHTCRQSIFSLSSPEPKTTLQARQTYLIGLRRMLNRVSRVSAIACGFNWCNPSVCHDSTRPKGRLRLEAGIPWIGTRFVAVPRRSKSWARLRRNMHSATSGWWLKNTPPTRGLFLSYCRLTLISLPTMI